MTFINVALNLQKAPDSISRNFMASFQKLFAISGSYADSTSGKTCFVFILGFIGNCALGEGGVR